MANQIYLLKENNVKKNHIPRYTFIKTLIQLKFLVLKVKKIGGERERCGAVRGSKVIFVKTEKK